MTAAAGDAYQELYEAAACGLLTLDVSGVVVGVNRTLLEWTGRAREHVVGTPFINLLPSADQLFYETRFGPVMQLQGELREVSLTMITAGGTLPILMNARATPTGVRMAVFDATERQGYERALLAAQRAAEASEARVRVLQEAAAEFAICETEADLAERLVEATRQAMSAGACGLILVDENGAGTLIAGQNPLGDLARDPMAADAVAAVRAAGIVTVGSLDDARERYPALVDGMVGARIEAFSVVPIEGASGVLGALMCFFGRRRDMSLEDIDLQVTLARGAALVLARIRLQAELRALALHDQLTGLPNRRLLREHLVLGMASAGRRGLPIALMILDLDGFKSINDARGHQEGDAVLTWVARRVGEVVRLDDVVGRFGGDEFIVICHDADQTAAVIVAERIREAISTYPERLPDGEVLTASVGVAICAPERVGERPEDFFAVADAALYRSKREGKDRVSVDWI